MPLKPENPNALAKEIAYLLDNDPIMASRIKEYLSHERLRDLLQLNLEVTVSEGLSVGEGVEYICSHTVADLLNTKRVCG